VRFQRWLRDDGSCIVLWTRSLFRFLPPRIMSLDTFKTRTPENVPGKFYVGDQCTDCDYCREVAPDNFARNDEHGGSYVKMQPQTAEQVALCREAAVGCHMETIHDDGDAFDWAAVTAVPPPLDSRPEGQPKCPSCCEHRKGKGRRIARGRLIILALIALITGAYYFHSSPPSFSGETASSIDITTRSPLEPEPYSKPDVLLQTGITSQAACASLLALLRSARDHTDHQCADIGTMQIHYANGLTDTLTLLPGHDPARYEFRFARGAYHVPRDRFYQVLRDAGIDTTKVPQSEH
jgi:ferredoxin